MSPPDLDLTRVADLLSDGVLAMDAEWRISYVNARVELLLRRRRAELLGASWWDLFPYLLSTPAERQLREADAGADPQRIRIFHPPLYAWHDVWVSPADGRTMLVLRDTTDMARLRQQEAVRDAVREVIEEAPIAISVMRGPDHQVEVMNRFGRQLLGGRSLEGSSLRTALPELGAEELLVVLDEVFRTGEPFSANEMPIRYDRFGTGEMYEGVFNVVYQPILDVNGAISGLLSVSVEVTDLVRARGQLT